MPGGDVASSLAIGELAPLDGESHGSDDALAHLERAVRAAHGELLARVQEEPQLAGMGTTITALMRAGNRLALAHIGDSRAYLLRDGVLAQITKDHTFVQTLVDEGRLTPEEAEHHPQRSVLMRVLSDIVDDPEPDFSIRESRVGDRYLLCSDGLSGVVSFETLQETLASSDPPGATCERLVALARRAGAPDNVTCIVADVVDEPASADAAPSVVGAASVHPQRRPPDEGSAAERAAALTAGADPDEDADENQARPRSRTVVRLAGVAVVAAVLAAGAFAAWHWVRQQYFVGVYGQQVAVYRGLPQDLGPLDLATLDHTTGVLVDTLPPADQDSVRGRARRRQRDRGRGQGGSPPRGRLPREPGRGVGSRGERLARSLARGLAQRLAPGLAHHRAAGAGVTLDDGGNTGAGDAVIPLGGSAVPFGQPRRRRDLCRCPMTPRRVVTSPAGRRRWRWRS